MGTSSNLRAADLARIWTRTDAPSPLVVSPIIQRAVSPAETEISVSPASSAMSHTCIGAA